MSWRSTNSAGDVSQSSLGVGPATAARQRAALDEVTTVPVDHITYFDTALHLHLIGTDNSAKTYYVLSFHKVHAALNAERSPPTSPMPNAAARDAFSMFGLDDTLSAPLTQTSTTESASPLLRHPGGGVAFRTTQYAPAEAQSLMQALGRQPGVRMGHLSGILGCVRFLEGYYVVGITRRRLAARIGIHRIFEVGDVTLLSLGLEPQRVREHLRAPATPESATQSPAQPRFSQTRSPSSGMASPNIERARAPSTVSMAASYFASILSASSSALYSRQSRETVFRQQFLDRHIHKSLLYSHTYDLSNTLQTNMTTSSADAMADYHSDAGGMMIEGDDDDPPSSSMTTSQIPLWTRQRRMKYVWNEFLLEPLTVDAPAGDDDGNSDMFHSSSAAMQRREGSSVSLSSMDGETGQRTCLGPTRVPSSCHSTSTSPRTTATGTSTTTAEDAEDEETDFLDHPEWVFASEQFGRVWALFAIRGAVVQRQLESSTTGHTLLLTIIARTSKEAAGTRYRRRGVDVDGNVANHVEVEQILSDESTLRGAFTHGNFSSYVQVRGSVPVRWFHPANSSMPKPDIVIAETDIYHNATCRHFRKLLADYGAPIVVMDFLKRQDKRARERALGECYRATVEDLRRHIQSHHAEHSRCCGDAPILTADKVLRYRAMDLRRVADRAWNAVTSLSEVDADDIGHFTCFASGRVASMQSGVLRSNCVDCVDRTNIGQYFCSLRALGSQLSSMGIIGSPADIALSHDVAELLLSMYLIVGDATATQYGGSAQVGAGVLHRGRGWDQVMGIKRFYANFISDAKKQQSINLFLGRYQPHPMASIDSGGRRSHACNQKLRFVAMHPRRRRRDANASKGSSGQPRSPQSDTADPNRTIYDDYDDGDDVQDTYTSVGVAPAADAVSAAGSLVSTATMFTAPPAFPGSVPPSTGVRASLAQRLRRAISLRAPEGGRRSILRGATGDEAAPGALGPQQNSVTSQVEPDYYLHVKGGPSLPSLALAKRWWIAPLQWHNHTCSPFNSREGDDTEAITYDSDRLLSTASSFAISSANEFGDFPPQHWQHRRTSQPLRRVSRLDWEGSREQYEMALMERAVCLAPSRGLGPEVLSPANDDQGKARAEVAQAEGWKGAEQGTMPMLALTRPSCYVYETSMRCCPGSATGGQHTPIQADDRWARHVRLCQSLAEIHRAAHDDDNRTSQQWRLPPCQHEFVHSHIDYPGTVKRSVYTNQREYLQNLLESQDALSSAEQRFLVQSVLSTYGPMNEWSTDDAIAALKWLAPELTSKTLLALHAAGVTGKQFDQHSGSVPLLRPPTLPNTSLGLEAGQYNALQQALQLLRGNEASHHSAVVVEKPEEPKLRQQTSPGLDDTVSFLQTFFVAPLTAETVQQTLSAWKERHLLDPTSGVAHTDHYRFSDQFRDAPSVVGGGGEGSDVRGVPDPSAGQRSHPASGSSPPVPVMMIVPACFSVATLYDWLLAHSATSGMTFHTKTTQRETIQSLWRFVWWLVTASVVVPVVPVSSFVVAGSSRGSEGKAVWDLLADQTALFRVVGFTCAAGHPPDSVTLNTCPPRAGKTAMNSPPSAAAAPSALAESLAGAALSALSATQSVPPSDANALTEMVLSLVEALATSASTLQEIDITFIPPTELLPFWVNVFNALYVHACLERSLPIGHQYHQQRVGMDVDRFTASLPDECAQSFLRRHRYIIGGLSLSLYDIKYGLLCANRPPHTEFLPPFPPDLYNTGLSTLCPAFGSACDTTPSLDTLLSMINTSYRTHLEDTVVCFSRHGPTEASGLGYSSAASTHSLSSHTQPVGASGAREAVRRVYAVIEEDASDHLRQRVLLGLLDAYISPPLKSTRKVMSSSTRAGATVAPRGVLGQDAEDNEGFVSGYVGRIKELFHRHGTTSLPPRTGVSQRVPDPLEVFGYQIDMTHTESGTAVIPAAPRSSHTFFLSTPLGDNPLAESSGRPGASACSLSFTTVGTVGRCQLNHHGGAATSVTATASVLLSEDMWASSDGQGSTVPIGSQSACDPATHRHIRLLTFLRLPPVSVALSTQVPLSSPPTPSSSWSARGLGSGGGLTPVHHLCMPMLHGQWRKQLWEVERSYLHTILTATKASQVATLLAPLIAGQPHDFRASSPDDCLLHLQRSQHSARLAAKGTSLLGQLAHAPESITWEKWRALLLAFLRKADGTAATHVEERRIPIV